jgi:rhamnosyltransferase
MSSYNGERYIREQLDSIFRQSNVEVHLYIRDDCSTDRTIDIIQSYSEDIPLKIIRGSENVGAPDSFLQLLYLVGTDSINSPDLNYDYYAFADQDDIWLPDKLSRGIEILNKLDMDIPLLYYSNRNIYAGDVDNGLCYETMEDPNFLRVLNGNKQAYGCTFIMNEMLVKTIISKPFPPIDVLNNRFHDSWCLIVAVLIGKVIADKNSYILYRIHDNNTVGVPKFSIKEYVKHIIGKGRNNTNRYKLRSKTAKALKERYASSNSRYNEILDEYSSYDVDNKIKKKLLKDKEVLSYIDKHSLIARLRVLLKVL